MRNSVMPAGSRGAGRGFLALLLAGGVWWSGCATSRHQGAAAFASITITGNTPGQISEVAQEVFEENGYLVAKSGFTSFIVEKKAGGFSNLAYGNWGGGSAVWERVKVSLTPMGEQQFRLQCQPYLVRDRASATEEEIKISSLHRKTYQKILNEVAKRLASPL